MAPLTRGCGGSSEAQQTAPLSQKAEVARGDGKGVNGADSVRVSVCTRRHALCELAVFDDVCRLESWLVGVLFSALCGLHGRSLSLSLTLIKIQGRSYR